MTVDSSRNQPGKVTPADTSRDTNSQHSLFGEILDWMLMPLLLIWPAIFNGYCAGRAAIGDPLTAASSYVSA